ncbi:MAG: hypothetical protein K0R55_2073 [Sporomusa sp.]|jgi:hypothetical protein|nr:hypothetical protein [Sporomusa sp.]
MADRQLGYDELVNSHNSGNREDSNEVIIIIRDGKVVTFIQKSRNGLLECMYGDGI